MKVIIKNIKFFSNFLLLLFVLNITPYILGISTADFHYINDEQLRELAIEKGVIPKNIDKEYIDKNLQEQNTVIIWFIIDRSAKIALIDTLKEMCKDKENVKISKPSRYYVDEINDILYNSLLEDNLFIHTKKGIGVIFKTIAILEGDYDDGSGRSKIDILKDFLGEENFEWYKNNFPQIIHHLQEIDSKNKK